MAHAAAIDFQVSEAWQKAFPGAAAGLLAVSQVNIPATWPGLDQARQEIEADLKARFPDRQAIRSQPTALANQTHYKRFKKTYQVMQQVESVALKGRTIPSVTPLVQAMFMAELKNMMLTAGHDLAALKGPVRLEVSTGQETYIRMGGKEQQLKAGDMFMSDDLGIISDVIYGPDERSKITPQTSRALYAVYAPAGIGPQAAREHLQDIEKYIKLFSPEAQTDFLEVATAG